MSTANLNAKITANAKQFHSQMGKVKKSTRSVGKIFAGLGAALSVGLAFRTISRFIDKLDDIGKHAKRMGVSTDVFQQWEFAAKRAGTSIASFERGMKNLFNLTQDFKNGLSTAVDAFKLLGITLDDIKGKKPAEIFNIVTNSLKLMENPLKKRQSSLDAFGRAGLELIPVIEEYDKLITTAAKKGLISEEEIKAAEALKDSIVDFNQQLLAIVSDAGFITFLNTTLEAFKRIAKFVDDINNAMNFGNTNAEQRAAGGTGPGFDKSFLNLIGETLSDAFTFGLAAKFREAVGYGDSTSTAPITDSELPEFAEKLKKSEKEKLDIIIAQGQQMVKDAIIRGRQAKAQIELEKKAELLKLKAAEAEDKKLDSIRLATEILKAKLNLDERSFKIKKFELELANRLKNAENARSRELIKQQGILQKTLLLRENNDFLNKNFTSDASDNPALKKREKTLSVNNMSDRLLRIGGLIGGKGGIQKESPTDKKRNKLLEQVVDTNQEVAANIKNIGVLA